MERDRLKRSDEEEDTLARSTKKFKDSHSSVKVKEDGLGRNMGSYKDRLVGAIPGAFEQAFGFDCSMHDDLVSDSEEEQSHEGSARVYFSKEDKIRMRSPWHKALIIKTFGRRMGFSFLVEKIRSMWKPSGGMDCIDLGYDYYLVKFKLVDDVDHILKGGPWFIGQHFLAIRQWEPEFKASAATLSSVAVWIRLPELPIKYYENNALLKIGRAIGPILRIDSHTANGERGRFARLCIQVNLEKPLIRTVYLRKLAQCVQYEGINALCFSCGRIGHKVETCPYLIRAASIEAAKERDTCSQEQGNEQGIGKDESELNKKAGLGKNESELNKKEDYGEWMVVSRRKPNGKMRGKLQSVM